MNKFVTVDTIYGTWVVSRYAQYHYECAINTRQMGHPELTELMVKIVDTLPDNCVIVDVGSNMGIFSVPLAIKAKTKGGRVYSFEVQRSLFYALCGTAVLNDLDNLIAYNYGLGDHEHQLKIPKIDYSQHFDYGIISLVDQNKINNNPYEMVDIRALDQFNLERADFIKMDIEGMEIQAIQGAENTIKTHRPWMFIEYWAVDQNALRSWFDGLDYTLIRVDPANVLCCPNEKFRSSGLTFNGTIF
jgi:FkbM family methyltransferase